MPLEVVEHRLPEANLVCPECGNTTAEIGKEVRRRLKLDPAKGIVVEDWYYTYACRKCEQELNRQGVPLKRQIMSNWLIWTADHLLTPVYNQLHKELLAREVLHADETMLQVLREPGKTV